MHVWSGGPGAALARCFALQLLLNLAALLAHL